MHNGWHQIAFRHELKKSLTHLQVAGLDLMVVCKSDGELSIFDAACPHRGANLCYGGRIEKDSVVCPFHGNRIGLGLESLDADFTLSPYRVLCIGGLLFVGKSLVKDSGFTEFIRELEMTHEIIPGFTLGLDTTADLVIENAFDNTHFRPVHDIKNSPNFLEVEYEKGAYGIQSEFVLPQSPWQSTVRGQSSNVVPFHATAYSPTLVTTHLGGDSPYWMITATQQLTNSSCVVRLSVALPKTADGQSIRQEKFDYLVEQAQKGLMKDKLIWENIVCGAVCHLKASDTWVSRFREFSRLFYEEDPG